MQECHVENEAAPDGSPGAGLMAYRPLGFAKSARYRLSTAGAVSAAPRTTAGHGRVSSDEHVTGRS